MKPLLRLLKPDSAEVIVYLCVALALLLLQNIQRFWKLFDGAVGSTAADSSAIDTKVSDMLIQLESSLDPRLADFMIWVLVGSVIYVVASYIIAGLKSASEEAELVNYYRSPKGRAHEINAFMTKLAVRIAAAISYIGWLILFLQYVSPALSKIFFSAISTPTDPVSWLWAILTIILCACSLYLFAIFARFIVLRPRVFGDMQEL